MYTPSDTFAVPSVPQSTPAVAQEGQSPTDTTAVPSVPLSTPAVAPLRYLIPPVDPSWGAEGGPGLLAAQAM